MAIPDIDALRDGFSERCGKLIEAQRGKPFEQAEIEYDWNDRGNFTRKYAHSVTLFAMQAFHLDEHVDEANDGLQKLCRHYLDHPTDLYEAHSFHWSGALYNRLWAFFAEGGSVAADRMDEATQALMLEMMWAWSRKASVDLNSSTNPDGMWRFPNSENHHAMGIVTTLGFCGVLKGLTEYVNRTFDDGQNASAHYAAWMAYLKAYFRARSGKGQSVEIASKSYNAHTIQMWYNVFDFAEDAVLRRMAGDFLDLYWATWAEEQIDGIRGGGKNRIYQGPGSRTAALGGVVDMAALYLGERVDGKINAMDWVVATSGYRMPFEVMRLALEVEARGEYEVVQRCMGLTESGWERKPLPPVVPFGYNGLRSDFGGFLRYSYCTPDFVMGTLMSEARPYTDWSAGAAQNRWQGVIFRGHADAAIVPECLAVDRHLNLQNHANTVNQHWSVQAKGTLITQKLACSELSKQTGDSRVWISSQGLTDPVEKDGWVFLESDGAFAGVRVARGGYAWDAEEPGKGRWLRCEDDLSPIVIEVGRKVNYANAAAFEDAVLGNELRWSGDMLEYEGVSGDLFRFPADFGSIPEINGLRVDYAPGEVYNSPFVKSDWDSGEVVLTYDGSVRVLDFNEN